MTGGVPPTSVGYLPRMATDRSTNQTSKSDKQNAEDAARSAGTVLDVESGTDRAAERQPNDGQAHGNR